MSMDRVFKSDTKAFISPPVVLSHFLHSALHAEDRLYNLLAPLRGSNRNYNDNNQHDQLDQPGTDHHERRIDEEEAMDVRRQCIYLFQREGTHGVEEVSAAIREVE